MRPRAGGVPVERTKEKNMSVQPEPPRRSFLRTCALAGVALVGQSALGRSSRLLASAIPGLDPGDPEIPNEAVAKVFKQRFGDRPVHRGHVELDMPAVAEDGRVVPVIIESDLPMAPDQYVKGVHLIVDHNPDAYVAGFHLTPAIGQVSISTRIKMKRTTWVRAVVETNTGELWADYARVLVTLNGCG